VGRGCGTYGDGLRPTFRGCACPHRATSGRPMSAFAATKRCGHVDDGMCCVSDKCVSGSVGSGSSNELLSLLIRRMPHRADIAHKALIVTAGFPKYEALRGFR
jgi:hypothetical protein